MPYNGTGLFTRVYQWVNDEALGLNVDATRTDTDSNDIASGLSNCVTRDGQSAWLSNLPAGGYKITGLGNGGMATDSVNYAQVFNSPTFVTPRAATSPAASDNSTLLATTAMVQQVAIAAVTPAQPGGAGTYELTSTTSIAAWVLKNSMNVRSISGASTVTIADAGNMVECTAGGFTLAFDPVATLGDNTCGYIMNSATGSAAVTLDPSGIETIDGLASFVMYPNEVRRWYVDGTNLRTLVLKPFHATFTASGTFTTPPGYSDFGGVINSAGASGQRTNNTATASVGACAGGAFPFSLTATQMGASQAITIGAGGAQITGVAIGNAGGDTSIGSLIVVLGASFAVAGAVQTAPGINYLKGATTGNAVGFESPTANAGSGPNAVWGGGAASNGAVAGGSGSSIFGGGAGAGVDAAGNVRAAGTSVFAGNGGPASIAGNGSDGVAPSGGGGATQTGAHSGAGGRGQVEIWGIA